MRSDQHAVYWQFGRKGFASGICKSLHRLLSSIPFVLIYPGKLFFLPLAAFLQHHLLAALLLLVFSLQNAMCLHQLFSF